VNPIKYTCPRCGIHTCSLPCIKRHKSWAQCSGIRDPTAYRKRADLATPTSIDQDFNFITGVERHLQRADERVSGIKGIDLVPSGVGRRNDRTKLESEMEARGIKVVKAPKGLQRSKMNKSQWVVKKGIMWTIEWICYDGQKRLLNISEQRTIEECFVAGFGKKTANRLKRKLSTNGEGKGKDETRSQRRKFEYPPKQDEEQTTEHPASSGHTYEGHSIATNANGGTIEDELTKDEAGTAQGLHYYLFKPNTTSKVRCVVPVKAESTLQDVLRDRSVLEFPTLYARQEPPDALPLPFITEDQYNTKYGLDVGPSLPTYETKEDLEDGEINDLRSIDERKVLEVLQQDLNS
jgi:hypothetical protein